METFAPFTPTHAITFAVCTAIGVLLWRLGARRAFEPRVRRAWVACIFAVQTANVLYFLLQKPLDWGMALPLHVCDLMGWVAAWSLLTNQRLVRTVLVYAGLLLCGQAFLTPTLTKGPGTLRFWLFFATHLQIVASAFYELLVRGYVPSMRDAAKAWVVMFCYMLVLLPLDVATGWNYGYVGPSSPAAPTAIDLLGPWPWRIGWMGVIVATGFTALTLLLRPGLAWFVRRGLVSGSTLSAEP